MVINYHYLNKHTIKNSYPIPLIRELIDKLKRCNLFTKLDLYLGYTNVQIREGDEWKIAFIVGARLMKAQ